MSRRRKISAMGLASLAAGYITVSQGSEVPEPISQPPFLLAASYLGAPSADFATQRPGARTSTTEAQLSVGMPRFTMDEVRLDIGFQYQYTRYEYAAVEGRNRDLHRAQIPIAFTVPAGSWLVAGVVAPGVSTSSNVVKDPFNDLTSDDLLLATRLEGRRTAGQFTWLAGLGYDGAFGQPRSYPLVGMEFSPHDTLHVRLAFPDSAVRFSPQQRHTVTGRLFPAGHQWHVLSDELGDDFDYRIQALRAQLTWSYRWRSALTLDVSVGYETGRHHLFVDDQGRRVDADAGDQVLVAIGFRVGHAPLPYTHGQRL